MDQTTHVVDNLNPKNKGIQWQTSKSLQYSPHITELFFFWTAHGTVELYILGFCMFCSQLLLPFFLLSPLSICTRTVDYLYL